MDTEPQEIRNMFDSVALTAGLDQHTLFEWGGLCLCVCIAPSVGTGLTNCWSASRNGFKSLPVQST